MGETRSVNTNRILNPMLNHEVKSDNKKRQIRKFQNSNYNVMLGGGKDFMEERRLAARNRRINTILDFEQNKMSWNKDTEHMVGKIKEDLADEDFLNLQLSRKQDYVDPKLVKKLEMMEAGKIQLEENWEKSPLIGGPKKPFKTAKKIVKNTFEGQNSDIYFHDKKNYNKEERDFLPTKKMEHGNRKEYEQNKNGYLDQYKKF